MVHISVHLSTNAVRASTKGLGANRTVESIPVSKHTHEHEACPPGVKKDLKKEEALFRLAKAMWAVIKEIPSII